MAMPNPLPSHRFAIRSPPADTYVAQHASTTGSRRCPTVDQGRGTPSGRGERPEDRGSVRHSLSTNPLHPTTQLCRRSYLADEAVFLVLDAGAEPQGVGAAGCR